MFYEMRMSEHKWPFAALRELLRALPHELQHSGSLNL
jgi:hypothetical protein